MGAAEQGVSAGYEPTQASEVADLTPPSRQTLTHGTTTHPCTTIAVKQNRASS